MNTAEEANIPQEDRTAKSAVATSREECEEKLKDLVQKMKAELAAERERAGRTF